MNLVGGELHCIHTIVSKTIMSLVTCDYYELSEKISGSMMWCLTIVGVLFCDLSVRIRPVNNNLLAVNIATFFSSGILLVRKLKGSHSAAKTKSIKTD
jgi:hypothetical protein